MTELYFPLSLVDIPLETISSNVSFLTVASLHNPEHLPLKEFYFSGRNIKTVVYGEEIKQSPINC